MGETSKLQKINIPKAENLSSAFQDCRFWSISRCPPASPSDPHPHLHLLDLSLRGSKLVLLAAHLPVVKSNQCLGFIGHCKVAKTLEKKEERSKKLKSLTAVTFPSTYRSKIWPWVSTAT